MNKRLAVAFSLLVLGGLAPLSSAKPLPLDPPDPTRGIIGVRVKVIPPARIGSNHADVVYFVRVVDDADRFGAESLINSNYTDGRDVYLLNAKPGRYVAIGCRFTIKSGPAAPAGPGFQVGLAYSPGPAAAVFSKADILQTEVEVRAGAVAFMGAIEAHSSTKIRESDAAQAHYLRILSPAAANQNSFVRALSGNLVYTAAFKSIERGQAAEKEFWDDAIGKHFTNELAWVSRIAHGSSAPVVGAAESAPTAAAQPVAAPAVAAPAIAPGGTDATSVNDVFLSTVCVEVNQVKARANGQPKEAAEIARLVCQTVMTDWVSQGCRENPDQAACRKRLASFDGSLKSSGSSMLYAAAQAGQTSICAVMLAMGSDPNAATSTGSTPLMIATAENKPETVKLLLERGATVDAKNSDRKAAIVEPLTKAPEAALAVAPADSSPAAPTPATVEVAAPRPDRPAVRTRGNIPADRLDGRTYTSPDGGFELTVPPLITPGARAEERQVAEGMGVFFADDLGNAYYVMRTDNTQLKYDLEKIAAGYTINESLREKAIVATTRGSELRLAGVMPEASPIAQETKVKKETVLQKLDLHQAMSLFVTDAYIYEVAAGVTATNQQSDADMLARAKERLDAFLGGLRIKAAAPSGGLP